jgi:two-component system, cell cycle sensor histidine kinase and response regulator CckA
MTLQPYAIAKETANDRPANAQPPNDRSHRRTILLVEDEPFVREATCNILQHAGFDVLSAEDALKAAQIYEEHNRGIDLVMTDMVLPGRSGQQFGEDLRKHSPEVVVLVTSGYGNAEYEIEAPESRTYFLSKPYSRRTLLDKIEKILATVSLARAAGQAV